MAKKKTTTKAPQAEKAVTVSPLLYKREFKCTKVIFGSKGTQVVTLVPYTKVPAGYPEGATKVIPENDKEIKLFFEAGKECKFEVNKFYTVRI